MENKSDKDMKQQDQFEFCQANKSEMIRLAELAGEIWPLVFSKILSPKQIDYMLNWMYNPKNLVNQMEQENVFYFLKFRGVEIGFVGIQECFPTAKFFRIHKFYLHPKFHGKSLGKWMLNKVEEIAKAGNFEKLHLNVNRFNDAVKFYQNAGFEIIHTENIDIGEGYLMEDFVMVKEL